MCHLLARLSYNTDAMTLAAHILEFTEKPVGRISTPE